MSDSPTPVPDHDIRTAAEILHCAQKDWEYLSDEEKYGSIKEALHCLVENGQKVMSSPVTGNYYLVTRWIRDGDGRFTALQKREITEAQAQKIRTEEESDA